jgi:hypothetical protein
MEPHSSTRGPEVPAAFPETNQLSLLRVTGRTTRLSDFTLLGTEQGHAYNGLRIEGVRGARVSDLCVVGIPGTDHQPPGETFGINDYRTVGSDYRSIVVDGRGVGAAGFGANSSRSVSIERSAFVNERYSAGATFWQVHGISLTDVRATGNGLVGLNFERVSGRVRIVRPVTGANGEGDLRITSDFGSATYTIVDPRYSGDRLTIVLPATYNGGRANRQRPGDVHVLIDGRDRTNEVVRFVGE